MLNKILLYFNTVKYLKNKQLAYNLIRRFIHRKIVIDVSGVRRNELTLIPPIITSNKIDDISVCFLNVKKSFQEISDWTCINESKLWRYNLHYFDYLLDNGVSNDVKDKLISDWIDASHSLKVDAWEPYPVSLRIVNWIKYFIIYKDNDIPHAWLESLARQVSVLFGSIEHHILANHYLKNGKALFLAGAYLDFKFSANWYLEGKRILLEEAREQILDDGGHYEKSPMYHSIVVEDYLDIINLIISNDIKIDDMELSFLKSQTTKALNYLNHIVMPDGDIPLFNDAAFNIASHPNDIFDYAKNVLLYSRDTNHSSHNILALALSGYYIITAKDSKCIIDCGSVSPVYQPGHTHCDVLSYELSIKGMRVIVDTGVYDYDTSLSREYSRSTKAHNTLEIDDMEQSELWGSFRVARRSNILDVSLVEYKEGDFRFSGSYAPYWSRHGRIFHNRQLSFVNESWKIIDTVNGDGYHKINNYIHLHPDFDCQIISGEYYLVKGDHKIAKVKFLDNVDITIENGWYYPEFGRAISNRVIRLYSDGNLPLIQKYIIDEI